MRRTFVIHPLLFAIFPVVFLFAMNVAQFDGNVLVVPILSLLSATLVLWGLLTLILKDSRKAGLVVSLALLLFFSYGHLYRVLPYFRFRVWRVRLDPRHIAFMAWGLVFLIGGWFAVRTKRDLRQFTRILNVVAFVLVGLSALNITTYVVRTWLKPQEAGHVQGSSQDHIDPKVLEELPDIYYIILDAYARQDILKELFGCDNSGFLEELRKRGFYVADRSTSNYAHTLLCFTSTLNMNYVQKLLPDADPESDDLTPLIEMMRHSEVRRILKEHGYTTIAFSAGYMVTDMINADIYVAPGWFADEFPNALLDMTPIWLFFQKVSRIPLHRRRLLNTFEQLEGFAEKKFPKIVHAHLVCPHDPFVFGPNGEPVNPPRLNRIPEPRLEGPLLDEYRRYYGDQVTYLNQRILQAIDVIIAKSDRPPVIILQGDHGPPSELKTITGPPTPRALRERFSIFNAYYLPGEGKQKGLYPEISPVNSFRVVMNNYFGKSYERLEDRSYMSVWNKLYSLTDVTDYVHAAPGAELEPLPSMGTGE